MPESLPSDGRKKYEWQTRYVKSEQSDVEPQKIMRREALYLVVMMGIAFSAIIANYKGFFVCLIDVEDAEIDKITRIVYCLSAGLLGGVTFSIKIFYRAVARGQWNYDRRFWRVFQPLMSLSVTSVVAAFMMDDLLNSRAYLAYAIGYFAGYFSENAVGKMYDIAVVLFSSPAKQSKEDEDNDKSNK